MQVYADHAATTPVDPRVLEKMLPFFSQQFYNPSSLYPGGRRVRAAVDEARAALADCLKAAPEEFIFTSGGTEGDNLAVLGVMEALRPTGRTQLITSAIEHHAVGQAARRLRQLGCQLTVLPCGPDGAVRPESLAAALTPNTGLVSVMWANNETGALQPVEELCSLAHKAGALFHTDAVQAVGTQRVDLSALPADLLTLSSHKLYGPKGSGALFVRRGTPLQPRQLGGQQEDFRRGGTENTAAIVGLGEAVRLLGQERDDRCRRQSALALRLRRALAGLEGVRFNTPEHAVPGVLGVSFRGVEAEPLMILLGAAGIWASMGAACNSQNVEPSYVLAAMGVPEDYIRGSVRFSFGKDSTEAEADYIAAQLPGILRRLRKN